MLRLRRALLTGAATTAVVALTAAPAAAHPFFDDDATAPAASLTTVTLAIAHGCGTESDGGGDPTRQVAVEVPDEVRFLEAQPADGYELATEGDGPVPEVVVWTATDGGEPSPDVDLELVLDAAEGDEVFFRVFQGCDDFEYRWVGTPDDPADDPAVALTLAAPDPDSPPPDTDDPAGADATDDEAADDEAADGEAADDDPQATDADELPDDPAAAEGDESGGLGALPLIVGALVLAGLGALLVTKRRAADPAARPESTEGSPPGP